MTYIEELVQKRRHKTETDKVQEMLEHAKPAPKPKTAKPAKPVKPAKPSMNVKVPRMTGSNMFSVTVVGGVSLPGYPLQPGEKLAIVKLTPLAIGQ